MLFWFDWFKEKGIYGDSDHKLMFFQNISTYNSCDVNNIQDHGRSNNGSGEIIFSDIWCSVNKIIQEVDMCVK